MDQISNEIFYFGAGIAGIVAAVHLAGGHSRWRALAAALLSVIVFADAFVWHHLSPIRRALRPGDYLGSLTACDYIAPLAALFMAAIVENEKIKPRNGWVLFLAGAIFYCVTIIAYWTILQESAGATPRVREFSEHVSRELTADAPSQVATIVRLVYGGFAAASVALLITEYIRRRRALVSAAGDASAAWRLVCVGEALALWLYGSHVKLEPVPLLTKTSSGLATALIVASFVRPGTGWLKLALPRAWKSFRSACGAGGAWIRSRMRSLRRAGRPARGASVAPSPPGQPEEARSPGEAAANPRAED